MGLNNRDLTRKKKKLKKYEPLPGFGKCHYHNLTKPINVLAIVPIIPF